MEQEHVPGSWERGDPYEQYVGRWSRRVAPLFLSWLGIPPGRNWLDVGCGTGHFSRWPAQRGLRVVGVAISSAML